MLTPPNDREDQATKNECVQGGKYLKLLNKILLKLHDVATERDRAGNRTLHCDQYISLLLLYFFSPSLTSLRAIQRASELQKVQKLTGGGRVSLGSLSEAQHVFDPSLLRNILGDLANQALPLAKGKERTLRFVIGMALFLGCGENLELRGGLNVKLQPTGRLENEFVL